MPRPRGFDEDVAVAAAREQFWTHGYAGTSVADLTAATGLGKGSLYGAFGDKHALFLRALDDYIGTVIDAIQDQLRDPARSAHANLLAFLRGHAAKLGSDRRRRGCMLAKAAAELAATDDAVARAAERAYAIWQAELAGCIRQAQRDGDIDPAADPQSLAGTLLALLRGLEALHKGGARPGDLMTATEQVITLIPRGNVGPHPGVGYN